MMKLPFDKFEYYTLAVQSPDSDAALFKKIYKEITNKQPITLGEDFCGTFAICCEWVKLNRNHKAVGVDLSEEALEWGRKHHLAALRPHQQERIRLINANVMDRDLPKVDLIAAMNFSYYIFKTRAELKSYFENCYRRLNPGGVLVCDCFGGTKSYGPSEEKKYVSKKRFTYYWEQENYDPINNTAHFHIHFKPKNGKKHKKVFSYDWRVWSLPEIREVMEDVGFKTYSYWEGTDKKGEGTGEFFQVTTTDEECDVWIALAVGEKR